MTYKTILAHLTPGRTNTAVLQVARETAARSEARVIGVATCRLSQILYIDGYTPAAYVETDRAEIDRELAATKAEFETALHGVGAAEWRSSTVFESVADYVGLHCCTADLIVTGAYGHSRLREWALGGVTRHLMAQSRRCVLFAH